MRNLIKKIKTIISYLPVLWKDEDWDYFYLDALLLHKLKRMKNCFDKDGYSVFWHNNKRVPSYKALCICIEILEREQNDFYFSTYSHLINVPLQFDDLGGERYKLNENWKISTNMELYNKKEKDAEKCIKRDKELFKNLFSLYKTDWWI